MIKPIVRDVNFLSQESEPATNADHQVAIDLVDTLKENQKAPYYCVGLAANSIGVLKRVIAVDFEKEIVVMFNPKIISKKYPYDTEEACISLYGFRATTRYDEIRVTYQDIDFKKKTIKVSGTVAQIIQHEMDHLDGIII